MPDAVDFFRIVPVALLATPYGTDTNPLGLWQQETAVPAVSPETADLDGLGATTALYTIADAKPRAVTHRMGNGRAKTAQVALLDGAGYDGNGYLIATNLHSGLAGVYCKKRNLTQGDPAIQSGVEILAVGLTTDPNV